jgi:outer membrane biosynthesis protein TonB
MEVPGQVVGGTVKGVTDVSSALIGGVVSVGKELGKSLGASFRRESAEPQSTPEPAKSPEQPVSPPEPAKPPEPVNLPGPANEVSAAAEQKPAEAPDMNATISNMVEENLTHVKQAQDAANSTVTNSTEASPVQAQ